MASKIPEAAEGSSKKTGVFIEVVSAGMGLGDFSRFYVDGAEIGANAAGWAPSRGINIVVLDVADGSVVKTNNFDTYQSHSESKSLSEFLNAVKPGNIILASVKDEASWHLESTGRNTIINLGVVHIEELKYRNSWCMIAVKGDHPAALAVDAINSVGVARCKAWIGFDQGRSENAMAIVSRVLDKGRGSTAISTKVGKYSKSTTQIGDFVSIAFDPLTCSITGSYDKNVEGTSINHWLKQIPEGHFVCVTYHGESTSRSAYSNLLQIGFDEKSHADTGRTAVLGIKGAPIGSALTVSQDSECFGVMCRYYVTQKDDLTNHNAHQKRDAVTGALPVIPIAVGAAAVIFSVLNFIVISAIPEPMEEHIYVVSPNVKVLIVAIDYAGTLSELKVKQAGDGGVMTPSKLGDALRSKLSKTEIIIDHGEIRFISESSTNQTLTKSSIIEGLEWLVEDSKRGDLLYFHFIGHGNIDPSNGAFLKVLVPKVQGDANVSSIFSSEMVPILSKCDERATLTVALHSCTSGQMCKELKECGRGVFFSSSEGKKVTATNLSMLSFTGLITTLIARPDGSPKRPNGSPSYEKVFLEVSRTDHPSGTTVSDRNEPEMYYPRKTLDQLKRLMYFPVTIGELGEQNNYIDSIDFDLVRRAPTS